MITLVDVWEARRRVAGCIHTTSTVFSTGLSHETGKEIYLKTEHLQKTGSFKVRGAFNTMLALPPERRERGVIAFSSGNHAQAVAFAARCLGIRATVVMPTWVNPGKLAATREYGAQVILHGQTSLEMAQRAMQICEEDASVLVHPFDDHMTIAGQGTVGLEVLDAVPDADAIYVAIGGGGLISGIALAVKGLCPRVRVIGVQPERSCSMLISRRAGRVSEIDRCDTIADGLVAKRPGENTFRLTQQYVDDILTVTDDDIVEAMLYLLQRMKLCVEPSGAVALAGLLGNGARLGAKNVAILSGGNCDLAFLGKCLGERFGA